MKKKRTVRLGTVFFLVVAAIFISVMATYYYVNSLVDDIGRNKQLYIDLSNVEQIVSQNYINTVDAATDYGNIHDGIISGYIDGLGDEFSYYLNAKNYKTATVSSPTAVNIGIRAAYDKATGCIRADYVRAGSPAETAGVLAGDIITSVDGALVTEEGYNRSVQKLSAEEGVTVSLKLTRKGTDGELSIRINSVKYVEQTVERRLLENNIGYIFINEFTTGTASDFAAAVSALSADGVKGLIIDVRFNRGGDFDSAVSTADVILPAATICTRKTVADSGSELFTSDASAIGLPIIVLQNEKTSGVSELFCAALRDNGVAELVGALTAGNGTGQRDIAMSNNTAIRLSVYEYITPSGESYNGIGITPNYAVELDSEKQSRFSELTDEEDDQLLGAISHMEKTLGLY